MLSGTASHVKELLSEKSKYYGQWKLCINGVFLIDK